MAINEFALGRITFTSLLFFLASCPHIHIKCGIEFNFAKYLPVNAHSVHQQEKIPVIFKDDPVFKEFFMVAELLNMTHEEREAYFPVSKRDGINTASGRQEWLMAE